MRKRIRSPGRGCRRYIAVGLAAFCLTLPVPAQELTPSSTGLKPEVLLLARIKVHMEEVLLEQPNYTCVETVERSQRQAPSQRYRLMDTIRLEVALVDGAEMFSWPGESAFRSADVGDIVTSGAIGSGSFASHARTAFISNTATHVYAGREEVESRILERFDRARELAGGTHGEVPPIQLLCEGRRPSNA